MPPVNISSFFSMGLQYFNRKDYDKSYECFQKVIVYKLGSKEEIAKAHYHLGIQNGRGLGVDKNIMEAKKQFLLSGKLGHGPAYFELGIMYSKGKGPISKDARKAKMYYQKGCELNDNSSRLNLGCMYDEGNGVRQNQEKARQLFEEAAINGDVDALFNLAIMYENGESVPVDITKAMKYYCISGNYPIEGRNDMLQLTNKKKIRVCDYKCSSKEERLNNQKELKKFYVDQLTSIFTKSN